MKRKINILVAEDHGFFIDGLTSYLKNLEDTDIIHTASNGLECLKILENNPIDLLISDIDMPLMNGIELCQKIRLKHPDFKIIIVTQFSGREYIKPLIAARVNAILDKIDAKNDLEDAISFVFKNRRFYSSKILDIIDAIAEGKKTKKNTLIPHQTKREKEFLPYFCQGMSNIAITELLQNLPQKVILSPHTIEGHRKNLYMKFGVSNAAQLAKKAYDYGLIE